MGINISIATLVLNSFGLILLVLKNSGFQKAWVVVYVILILVHLLLFAYIGIAWSGVNVHPHMFNGFIFVSFIHLVYKVGIFFVYYKSIGTNDNEDEIDNGEDDSSQNNHPHRHHRHHHQEEQETQT